MGASGEGDPLLVLTCLNTCLERLWVVVTGCEKTVCEKRTLVSPADKLLWAVAVGSGSLDVLYIEVCIYT